MFNVIDLVNQSLKRTQRLFPKYHKYGYILIIIVNKYFVCALM